MSAFRESKFKHSVVSLSKKEFHYENLKTYQAQTDINGVVSNSKFLAYLDSNGSGSCVGLLPLSSVGKNHVPISSPAYQQPIIRAHSQNVQELEFDPFDRQKLYTCSADKTVKLWQIPEDGLVVDISAPAAVFQTASTSPVRGIACHPATASLLAARGSRELSLFDVSTQREIATSSVKGAPVLCNGDLQSMAWSSSGHVLLTTAKDKQLRMYDWRSNSGSNVVASVLAHNGLRFARAVWLGCSSPYCITVGHNAAQEREFMVWDSRKMIAVAPDAAAKSATESPGFIRRERIDSSNGPIVPLFDQDNGLLLLAGKGDTSLRLYEVENITTAAAGEDDDVMVHAISNNAIGGGAADVTRGACVMPKQANDMLACEVLRILKLSDGAIQPVSVTVPRLEKQKFHMDLFPPTVDEAAASMSIELWLAGANDPLEATQLTASAQSAATSTGEEAASASDTALADTKSAVEEDDDQQPSEQELARARAISKRLSSLGSSSKFRHMHGREATKEFTCFGLQPDLAAVDNPIIACNDTYWAIPYRGGGGPVYVSKLDQFGKVEPDVSCLNGHKSAVQDINFSPFHAGLMATGGNDSTIKLWDVTQVFVSADGGPSGSGSGSGSGKGSAAIDFAQVEPLLSLSTHRNSIRSCRFHPTVSSLLCSTSQDLTMRFFDAEAGSEVSCMELPQAVTINTSFNYDGTLVAVAGKDRQFRIVDPRAGSVVASTAVGMMDTPSQGSMKRISTVSGGIGRNLMVEWCATRTGIAADPIATVCSASSGLRQLQLWDPRMLDQGPICSKSIDNASGQLFPLFDESMKTLFLAGKGDTILRMYELHFLEEEQQDTGAAVTTDGSGSLSEPSGKGDTAETGTLSTGASVAAKIVSSPEDDTVGSLGVVPKGVLLEKVSEFQSSKEPIAGVCLLPKRCCDVRSVEVARLLKLTNDAMLPLSFKVPRAEHLKDFFHDDIFPPVRSNRTLATVPDWESADSDRSMFRPVLDSLQPDGMEPISERPPEPAPSQTKSKISSFKMEIKRSEEENAKKEDNFARLQQLAMQNAQYNVNKSGPVKIGGVVVSHPGQNDSDSSDGGWSDDD